MVQLLQMWALVEVLGIICLPLTFTIFKNLPDRGWAFTKIVGLALLAFCVWLPLMTLQFLPFSQLFIAGVLLIILAFSVIGYARAWKSIVQLVRRHLVYIIACELVFLGMMFLLGWIRSYGPEIQGFERYMDEGFLASIMRSTHFPPSDMWLSGYPINYYYYAHYTIAMLAKLLGQSPAVAFNTGICTFYGLTAVNIFGVTCNIVAWAMQWRHNSAGSRPRRARPAFLARRGAPSTSPVPFLVKAMPFGVLSLLMGEVLGNLASAQAWFQQHGDLPYFYWFNVSRVVDKTINEFPAFSFLLSDFHAHVLTLAFTMLAVAVTFNIFLEQSDGIDDDRKGMRVFGRGWRLPLNLGFMAIVLGGLFTMNGWDLPTYLGMAVICVALQQWMAYRRFCLDLVLDVFTTCASLIALSFFIYAPFYLNFISPSQGIGIVGPADRSKIQDEMLIYGTFMFIFVSFLLVNLFRERVPLARVPATGPAPAIANTAEPPTNSTGLRGFAQLDRDATNAGEQEVATTVTSSALTQTRPQLAIAQHQLHRSQDDLASYAKDDDAGELSSQDTLSTAPISAQQGGQVHRNRFTRPPWLANRLIIQMLILVAALLILVLMKNSLWFVVTFVITALGVELTLYHLQDRPRAFTLLLGTVAFALVAMTELVYLRDVFASSFPRMNTVFKFYFQAWALLSITSGAGMYFIFESFQTAPPVVGFQLWVRRFGQGVWSVVCLLLLLAGAIYPIVGSYQRTNEFMQRTNSLNGFTYMQSYNPGDYYAINWLNSHVQGTPVIVEAFGPNGGDYSDYARVSAFTGLPTLMGWSGHEYQWRVNWLNNAYNAADFYRRGSDINTIYTSNNSQTVLDLLESYHVSYLYVGSLEVATYAGYNLKRFSKFLPVVYSADGVTIYKVPGSA
ncbi:MAG TPA: DUF2298 domain-containing protein [Ktedonobacteraceae bacterium]|nr:DUF2298 domain-containing protein [Ktedonobacteraceae bacterium]